MVCMALKGLRADRGHTQRRTTGQSPTDLGAALGAGQGGHREGGRGEQVLRAQVWRPCPLLPPHLPPLSPCLVVGHPDGRSHPCAASVLPPCDPVFKQ